MPERTPLVSIVTDGPVMAEAAGANPEDLLALYETVLGQCRALLDRFEVAYEQRVLCAFQAPDAMREYAQGKWDGETQVAPTAWQRGIRVSIVLSVRGHLAGMIQSFGHRLNVIAVPVGIGSLEQMTAFLSVLQMPKTAGVIVSSINNGSNAAQIAMRILSVADSGLIPAIDLQHAEAEQAARVSRLHQ